MQTLPPISFGKAFKLGFQNYCKFTGRARRSEFFYFFIAVELITIILFIVCTIPLSSSSSDDYYYDDHYDDNDDDYVFLIFIPVAFIFATFCPLISLMVRRLHDIGYSGAFILISLIPFGSFFLLYLWCIDSEEGTNAYGPSPKYIMPSTIATNYNPPGNVIAVTPVVQPAVVLVPAQPTPIMPPPVAPYPQQPPMAPYPQQNPMVPPPMAPYPQQNPMVPPPQYPPVDPYSKPNPMQPQNDPYYNSRDFTGQ